MLVVACCWLDLKGEGCSKISPLIYTPLAPTVRGPGYPLAPPSDQWYGGLAVSLGDSEAWKPQKVGGCGWTGYP